MGTPRHLITLENDPAQADQDLVRNGLQEFNRKHIDPAIFDSYQPLCLFVRDNAREVLGGLLGVTYWGWFVIEILWLPEDLRGQGLGADLLRMAEAEAVKRGCHAAMLDTLSHQAPDFYQKHGYEVFAVLDDFPPGHEKIFLKKDLIDQT
jgi:GNAT superfamily N-acetyltransferase